MTEYAAVLTGGINLAISETAFSKLKNNKVRLVETNIELEPNFYIHTKDLLMIGPKTTVAQALGIKMETVDKTEIEALIESRLAPVKAEYETTIAQQLKQIEALKAAVAAGSTDVASKNAKSAKQTTTEPIK
jgi:hypothetical protein